MMLGQWKIIFLFDENNIKDKLSFCFVFFFHRRPAKMHFLNILGFREDFSGQTMVMKDISG